MATIKDVVRPLANRRWQRCPRWPPDVFAVAAYLLELSGAYLRLLRQWPPSGDAGEACLFENGQWSEEMRRIGITWRERWNEDRVPKEVSRWWKILTGRIGRGVAVEEIGDDEVLACALLQLAIAADEASFGAGIVHGGSWMGTQGRTIDLFHFEAQTLLIPDRTRGSTLCREIEPTIVRVLPKLHTPQSGMTLRSLTHHLSLWLASDVAPLWFIAPQLITGKERHGLNLLLLPWPDHVDPGQFAPSVGRLRNMPDEFRLFEYKPQREPDSDPLQVLLPRLERAFREAHRYCQKIDGVILPEVALDDTDSRRLGEAVVGHGSFLINGASQRSTKVRAGSNLVRFTMSLDGVPISIYQKKHHRWRIDGQQILQYGLGGQLDPSKKWWEHIELGDRSMVFIPMESWMTVCALVCEDLARQDPVSQLVRSVGPNLVVALLMDGPQLGARWPARYATVLAEDPGSSVLTLTSLGMCLASRPSGMLPSRSVALWKDATTRDPVPIELPEGREAILLNLVRHQQPEFTADGRRGNGASFPRLAGIHHL